MVHFQHRPWQIVTEIQKIAGIWPFQSKIKNYSSRILILFTISTMAIAEFARLVKEIGIHSDIVIENTVAVLTSVSIMSKLIVAIMVQQKRQRVYEKVLDHFQTIVDINEAEVLRYFASQGLRYTIIYMVLCTITVAVFDGLPVVIGLTSFFSDNKTLTDAFPNYVEYFVDQNQYYFHITVHFILFVNTAAIVSFSYDMTYIMEIQHISALFKIVTLRLQKASSMLINRDEGSLRNSPLIEDEAHSEILSAITLHLEALKMISLIEEVYSIGWLIVLLANMYVFGACLFCIAVYLHNSYDATRFLAGFIMFLIHFYVIFSQGQQIIDYGTSVLDACYDFRWYYAPKKSCFLLSIIMVRCMNPSQITGGNFFTISLETYNKMLKTGMSYFTVLRQSS